MTIICLDPQTDPLWQRLLECQRSSVFHSSDWIRVLTETYGLNVQAHVLLDDVGEPKAGIPFCRITDIIGERIVTLPFSDYCDPIVATSEQWNCLIEPVFETNCPIIIRCLHNDILRADNRFTTVKQAKWHNMYLQPELDALWRILHPSSRRAIEKARREGVDVRVARGKDELRTFFEMHLKIRKYKYHLLAQPYRFFEKIWDHFVETQHGVLMVASYRGEIIGGVIFFEWKDTLYYKFNASDSTSLTHRPNDLLIWEGIKYGKAKGYAKLDFGLSDWDQAGLVRYKRKFATEEKTISFLRYTPEGIASESETQARTLLARLTDLFTDASVPDDVTDKAGDLLYRFFV